MPFQPFLQTINRRGYDNLTWLRPFVRQPAPLLLLPAATVGAQWSLAALIAICCLAMSWLARKNAIESARYQAVKWLVERIESEPQLQVYEPTDYFPGSRPEDIWPNGEPVLVSVIVVPTLNVPKAAPLDKDRTIVAFHSRPDQMLGNPYRYYPLLHEFGHVGKLHARAIAFWPRNRFGYISIAVLVMAFANPIHWLLLPLLVAFACWATMFCYEEETLQAEVAADHFALEATRDLTQAGFFRGTVGDHRDNAGPLSDDTPLQGVDEGLPKRLQKVRSDIFGRMRADIRTNGVGDLKYYCDLAIREHGRHVEGLIVVGFALAFVLCSIFAVQNVSLPGPLALIAPAILLIFYLLVAATYWDLSERLLTAMQKSDPEGTQRSLQTASEWTARSRPRTVAISTWMERLSQRLDRRQ
jgi:hypothetical protein